MRLVHQRSLLLTACTPAALLLAGCCCDTEAWQTGRRDIVGATPVVVPSPTWSEGITTHRSAAPAAMAHDMQVTRALATVNPTEGNNARGTVRFEETPEGLRVIADLQKLPPSSTLGFHIHEFGDVSAPDGTSAGDHYNPGGHQHAGPSDATRHAGDLGNVQTDASGNAHLELVTRDLSLTKHNPVLGRTVVVHAKPDDLKSQPSGNAGPRIGVGVIGSVKP